MRSASEVRSLPRAFFRLAYSTRFGGGSTSSWRAQYSIALGIDLLVDVDEHERRRFIAQPPFGANLGIRIDDAIRPLGAKRGGPVWLGELHERVARAEPLDRERRSSESDRRSGRRRERPRAARRAAAGPGDCSRIRRRHSSARRRTSAVRCACVHAEASAPTESTCTSFRGVRSLSIRLSSLSAVSPLM